MSKKLSIKPIHLVFIGLAIIVLGILIPSFFINPFSTVGFSVIIGSIILLSAYVFFAVNLVRSKGKKTIKWLLIPVVLAVSVAGGLYAYVMYNQSLVDKIYSVGDVVRYPNFTLEITKAEIKPVDLPVSKKMTDKYGGINSKEDCEKVSKIRPNSMAAGRVIIEGAASDFNLCHRRNNSRDDINKYSSENRQLVIDYKLTASDTVETSGIKIELIPDSGRKLGERVNAFNGGYLFEETDNFFDHENIRYEFSSDFKYAPYHQSELGGNIGKGLERKAYLYTDVRTSEQTADFILTYTHNGTTEKRTIRINISQ